MPVVIQHAAARIDLEEHFVSLAENAGLKIADRFLDNAEAGFALLAEQPRIGAALDLRHPQLANVRKWRIKGFENHLVFYEPRPDGVSVIRVLHAASDWWSLLGFDEAHTSS